jgi:cytochrome c553
MLLLNACGGGAPPAPEQANGAPDQRTWMRTHFEEGQAIRDAVVQGELDDARARLARLGAAPGPRDAPASWAAHLGALQSTAQRGGQAQGRDELAATVGSMAVVCGDCHAAVGAQVPLPSVAPPAADDTPAQMRRHHWAAERMWEGLVAPAPDRYRDGASVLASAPMHPSELVVGASPPLEVVALAERARSLAGEATGAESPADRGRIYGQLLATCASCHGQQPAR